MRSSGPSCPPCARAGSAQTHRLPPPLHTALSSLSLRPTPNSCPYTLAPRQTPLADPDHAHAPPPVSRSLSRLPGFLLRTHIPTSEGSHFVNVFAPGDVHQGEDLPVLVWVYGGALNNGDAGRFFYDPTELVRDSAARDQRCIVVTLNYRTNIFGAAPSASRRRGGPDLTDVDACACARADRFLCESGPR